jgi:hypothetical protein
MKNKIILAWTFCLLPLITFASNESDSIHSIESEQSISLPDSIIQKLKVSAQLADSLSKENAALKGLLRGSQMETAQKESEIAKLKSQISNLQNVTLKHFELANDTLQLKLISMASNFLYIPYEAYSIDEIAIPAFKATNGSKAYSKYQNRLPLLINYKTDVQSLIEYLAKAEKDLSIGLTKLRNDKAVEHLNILEALPLYTRYSTYNDWKNTYLGTQIIEIQKQLKTPSEKTSTQLKNIRVKLENLLMN